MNDNNENNIDETTGSVNEVEQTVDEDALEGFTEEDVTDADVNESSVDEGAEADEAVKSDSYAKEESFGEKLKNMNKKQIGCLAVVGVVIVAVIVAIVVMSMPKKGTQVTTTPVTTASTTQAVTKEQETTMATVVPEKEVSIEELQQTNEDIYAYIYVPGTEIDYPILQSESKGENYYINYTVNNYYSWTGAIYTQFTYNKKDFTDKNTVIYGHSASRNINSVMFTQLHYYEDPEFFKANPYFYIYYGEKQFKYQIFAAVRYSDALIPYYYDVTSGADTVKYVEEAKTLYGGVIDDSVTIDENSRIVTLSTCTMYPDYNESQRYMVLGKLVEESIVQR